MEYIKHIMAIEGEWSENLNSKETIKSALDFLNENGKIESIFRKVSSQEALYNYLDKVLQSRYKKYAIIYLSFHGTVNNIQISKTEIITLKQFAEDFKGALKNKIIHFSSCSTCRNTKSLEYFKKITNAELVSGYKNDIGFIDSTLLDIGYFTLLQEYVKFGYIEKKLNTNYGTLCKRLGFIKV